MNSLTSITFALVLVTLVLKDCSAEYHDLDYRPCIDDYEDYEDPTYFLDCHNDFAKDIADAFRRNSANTNVSAIIIDMVDDMTDEIMDDIFDSLSSSAQSLTSVYMARMPVTRVPENIGQFSAIRYFEMNEVSIKTLPSGALNFPTGLEMLYFYDSQIETIEAGALQGDFSDTGMGFDKSLQRFDEDVFKTILQSKFNSSSRSIVQVDDNPIPCDCNLAWLLRDNRHLLAHVRGSCISASTGRINFNDYDPYALSYC